MSADSVNRPAHYTMGKIETLDFIEDQKFCYHAGNAIKYICRYRYKGKPVEDLRKAIYYLNRLADNLEKETKCSKTG